MDANSFSSRRMSGLAGMLRASERYRGEPVRALPVRSPGCRRGSSWRESAAVVPKEAGGGMGESSSGGCGQIEVMDESETGDLG
jgi:hypothetical protein